MNRTVTFTPASPRQLPAVPTVGWVEVGGRLGKFYHSEPACKAQLDKDHAVFAEERDAQRRGVVLCPDCEKQRRYKWHQRRMYSARLGR